MRTLFCLIVISLSCLTLRTADNLIVVAGGGTSVEDGPATSVKVIQPFFFFVNADGSAWLAEQDGNRIRRYNPDGALTTVVGTGIKGTAGIGGPGIKAKVNGPHHVLVLTDSRLLIGDTYNRRTLQYNIETGIVSTFAGTGEIGYSGDDCPANVAQTSDAYSLALSAEKNIVYLADI